MYPISAFFRCLSLFGLVFLVACSPPPVDNDGLDATPNHPPGDCDALTDGADCGDGKRCREGQCLASTCGNGIVEEGEECDDGNLIVGDGCENDCTFSCSEDADCLDDDLCTVGERCVEVSGGKRCQAGARVQCPPEDANPCLMYTCDPDAAELGYCRSSALTGCYPDEDRDDFPLLDESRRVDPEGASCSCPKIGEIRYIHPRTDGRWDCDDTSPFLYPGASACYLDEDGDGYPSADDPQRMNADCGCDAPLVPRREDGLFDCDDTDPRHHPIARCVFDRDGDGFPADEDAAPMNAACECPASAMLEREDGLFDCDDEDANIYPSAPCFPDDDGDGFYASNARGQMDSACACPAGEAPLDPDAPVDCDDTNDDVRPDQTAYFTEGYCPGEGKGASCPADANSFDYNCDLEEEFAGESACGQNYDSCCGLPPNPCWGVEMWKTPSPRCGQVEPILTCLNDCSAISGSSRVPCR